MGLGSNTPMVPTALLKAFWLAASFSQAQQATLQHALLSVLGEG
jgi:hypothetical protein